LTVNPIFPIGPDRPIAAVELRKLSPIQREQDKQRREAARERQRRKQAEKRSPDGSHEGHPGIDVRA
jgi:hypothetical protein